MYHTDVDGGRWTVDCGLLRLSSTRGPAQAQAPLHQRTVDLLVRILHSMYRYAHMCTIM